MPIRKKAEGEPRSVESVAPPAPPPSRERAGTGRDAIRDVQIEQRLHQTHKMEALGTLAGGIAHDLNNILMPIIMNAELLVEDLDRQEEQRRLAEKILASATRGRDLVRQVVTFSRRSDERHRPLVIAPVVEEALELLRASLPPTIEIRKHIECWGSAIHSDPTQIHQVLLNLCSNAAHAMSETGGILEVGLFEIDLDEKEAARFPDMPAGRYVSLEVRDSGEGIEPEVMDRMFEPFYTTKKPGEGTGMGLAVVHGIVSGHRGTIEISSAPGRGSLFTVLLPAVRATESRGDASQARPAPGRGTILLVDDEEPIVESAKEILERLGYDVIACTDPCAALEIAIERSSDIDLALVDHMMPGMTGLELAGGIRDADGRMPVILYTGHTGVVDQREARECGVRDILAKPLTRKELGESIRRAISERG